ncbi:MAG: glutathione peroxidase [Thermotogaceae bacterium]|nr:glutathione peroxidase [Thermotogaceae bacterium]
MGFYDYSARKMNGREVKMETYKGKVVIVVNTASKCGFTPQFAELETLYKKYKDQGLAILGFPCNQFANQDPASNQEIQNFCQLNYGVSFDMFEKVDVNGPETTPLYQFLKEEAKGAFGGKIKWNFTKFLIDRKGEVIRRYAPATPPLKMEEEIKKLLAETTV